jgi:hypothetical protein
MTLNDGQSGSCPEPLISGAVAREIASCFKLSVRDIVLDAQAVSGWDRPADDLLVSLEHRHEWTARAALAYLLSLRHALHLASRDRAPGS